MAENVHFDLAELEATARKSVAGAVAALRQSLTAKGKDTALADLQESMQEISIVASVRMAKAMNDGHTSRDVLRVMG